LRIFVSPLDWGLGHAARCIPLIRYLLEKKAEIVIGAEGAHLTFLKEYFPHLEYIEFPGYRISYSSLFSAGIKVLSQVPQLVSAIKNEHVLVAQIIKEKKIDAVISDNRYGLWNRNVPCVIITHQLNIQAAAGSSFLSWIIYSYIKHFRECWIPDYEGEENLSGVLSHPVPKGINGKYIGPLSRFGSPKDYYKKDKYDLLVILSGPEPQRTKLEQLVLSQLKDLPHIKTVILQGLLGAKRKDTGLPHVEMIPHVSDEEFHEKVMGSNIVLSRPGYSTLMDLSAIGWKKSILIPTPGQTEQEYLGKLVQEKGIGISYPQKNFILNKAIQQAGKLKPIQAIHGNSNYKKVVDDWLSQSH